VLTLTMGESAMAWGNHSFPAYRAFEKMPEVASAAPVAAEPLEAFLKSEEKTIEVLLASHEAWGAANLEKYPARPAALAFIANPKRSDDARRLAFLMALRVAPNSKFALYFQPDPRNPVPNATFLPSASVSTLPESANSGQAFIAIKPGEPVPVLNVIASASAEPDYGLDINLWDDSPSDWGKVYSFGSQPFGNPALSYSTQAPFHMGFSHESRVLYMAAPFIKRTFPLLRSYQFSTLASLAFRTGHPYWGWRFAGLSLHYLQDLTQPYHSSLAPGDSVPKLLGVNLLAMAGLGGMKEDMIVLLSNRHLALEKYQTELLLIAAGSKLETPIERSLRSMDKDRSYPEWSDGYVRDIVSAQSASFAGRISELIVTTMPSTLVSDPAFDFGAQEGSINLVQELAKRPNVDRTALDDAIAQLLGNFGAHSRNAMRGILKASNQP
jgi:hypothetical protein